MGDFPWRGLFLRKRNSAWRGAGVPGIIQKLPEIRKNKLKVGSNIKTLNGKKLLPI